MPCRESRPLDDLKFVLVKCEWVLEDGALKWKSHSITGHVKMWPGSQYLSWCSDRCDWNWSSSWKSRGEVLKSWRCSGLWMRMRLGRSASISSSVWLRTATCKLLQKKCFCVSAWFQLLSLIGAVLTTAFTGAVPTAWTLQRFQPLTLERFQPLYTMERFQSL